MGSVYKVCRDGARAVACDTAVVRLAVVVVDTCICVSQ